MMLAINYRGPFITDTPIPGERKADGIIPAHPGCPMQLSARRWIIFFANLDPRGWDANHSILYQLRADAPDGRVIAWGVIDSSIDDWDPFRRGDRFFKTCGMPIAFGVPKGATYDGVPIPHANVFAVKWYRVAQLQRDGAIVQPNRAASGTWPARLAWPEGFQVQQQTLRLEWMQFRLNDREDDIEPLTQPALLRQRGCEAGNALCSLGPDFQVNHAMKPPVQADPAGAEWIDVNRFTPYGKNRLKGASAAAVRYRFNPAVGLYEWTHTGPLVVLPDREFCECSMNRMGDHWVIAARSITPDGFTCWFRTQDPFSGFGKPTFTPSAPGPRIAFVCGDGRLRLFGNTVNRSPLFCWDVNPLDFSLSNQQPVLDAKAQGLPFYFPFVDMAKLSPVYHGNRQLLLHRMITRRQTACRYDLEIPVSDTEHRQAGIYASEFMYRDALEPDWCFDTVSAVPSPPPV